MNFFIDNWITLLGLLASPLAYMFGGKQKQRSDSFKAMQEIYDGLVNDTKARVEEITGEIATLRTANRDLQKQFNDMHLAYAKETELAKHWESSYNELTKQFSTLSDKYDALYKDHELLKKQVQINTKKK